MDNEQKAREQQSPQGSRPLSRDRVFDQGAEQGQGRGPSDAGELGARDVFDHAFGFLGILTPDGILVEVNRSPLDLAGFVREQVLGRPFWETGWWDRSPAVQAQLRADFAEALQGRAVRREVVYFTADGQERVVDRTLTPVTDPTGRVVRVLAEGRDVTDRKRAEEALARAERRFRALVEHQFDGISLNAADGTVFYISPSARRLLGRTEDEVVGHSAFEFIHPEDHARATRTLQDALQTPRTAFGIELQVQHRDRSWRWLEIVVQNLLDEPAVGALVCNYRDVTDQRRAEAARRENEARFLALLHQSAAGVVECDPAGQFVRANDRACEIVGRPAEELYRLRLQDVIYPDDLPGTLALFERAVREGRPFVVEHRFVRPDGTHVWVCASACAVPGPDGTTEAVMAVGFDVTDRKRAEEALRLARDELEQRVRERTAELEAERGHLQEVFRLAPSFMAVLRGPDHVLERMNDRFTELVARHNVIGRPVRQMFPEVEGQGFFEILDQVYRTGQPFFGTEMPMKLRRGGGSLDERILDFVYQPLCDAVGAVTGIFVHGIDQTDRVRAEQTLREQAEMLDLATDAIVIQDPGGTITYWNQGAERLYEWAREEALGRNVNVLLGTIFPRALAEIVAEVARSGHWEGELTHTRRGGSAVVVSSRWNRRLDRGGNLAAILMINTDLTERRQAAQLREQFIGQLIAAEEEERKRVARELHDGIAQTLSALRLRVGILGGRDVSPPVRDELAELKRAVQQAVEEVRFLARGLRPPVLDKLGLLPALTRYAEDFKQAHGIRAEVVARGPAEARLPPEVETALYRISQEALANVARHSGATAVSVVLVRQPASVQLLVEDDGKGWDAEAPAAPGDAYRHLGLQGMRERAALLGGEVTVESSLGSGTTVRVRIPLGETAHEKDPGLSGR